MPSTRRKLLTPLLAALLLGALLIGVTGCGSGDPSEVEEGEVVKVGSMEYQVVFSRYLNENDAEDTAYLVGQAPAGNEENYFGVFLQVKNPTHGTLGLVPELWITDAEDKKFDALPSESEFGFPFGGHVEENEAIPIDDSTAQSGPIQGAVAIFKLPESISSNRPLLLHIPGAGSESGIVKLDL
jgi:hypothetical protein